MPNQKSPFVVDGEGERSEQDGASAIKKGGEITEVKCVLNLKILLANNSDPFKW